MLRLGAKNPGPIGPPTPWFPTTYALPRRLEPVSANAHQWLAQHLLPSHKGTKCLSFSFYNPSSVPSLLNLPLLAVD